MSLLKACLEGDPGRPLVHVDDYKLYMKGKVVCPQCNGDVVAKMGCRNVHHFAHKSKMQCDPWTEPMTAWHKGWQDLFKPDYVEVMMTGNNVKHIADVAFEGHILEIQHSPISASEVMERESFYTTNGESLTWIVDGRSEKDCIVLGKTWTGYAAIWARRSWWWAKSETHSSLAKSMVLIDTRIGLFKVICYSDKGVGLAEALTTIRWHGVAGGLTLPGAQRLQEMLSSCYGDCPRLLYTTFAKAEIVPYHQLATSTCKIVGDTFPHKDLFKKLGMTWNQNEWVICHDDEYDRWKRITELWHRIAERILLEMTRKPPITQWTLSQAIE